MNVNQGRVPELSALRRWCGERRDNGWFYQPFYLRPEGTPKSAEAIAPSVDKRTLAELEDEIQAPIQQLLFRAYAGDASAQHKFARVVSGAVQALGRLATSRGAEMKAVAETFSDWPVMLSLNPQRIRRAKQQLEQLRVGSKGPLPTHSRQKLDPQGFWTELATRALKVVRSNLYLLPALREHTRGAKKSRATRKFWNTTVNATIYTRSNGDKIIIADWLKVLCPALSEPITAANFPHWWKAVKLTVLDYWKMYLPEYEKALGQIRGGRPRLDGKKDDRRYKEDRRRNLAIRSIRQALASLTGVR